MVKSGIIGSRSRSRNSRQKIKIGREFIEEVMLATVYEVTEEGKGGKVVIIWPN